MIDTPEEIKIIFNFNKELHDLVDSKLTVIGHIKTNKDFFAAFVIGKAFKTHEAITLLARNGYGEDAFILARTLFELMVTTAYIFQDETDERLLRYVSYDHITRKQSYNHVLTSDYLLNELNKDIDSKKIIDEIEAEYKEAMDKYHYKDGWSDKGIADMAKDVGKLDMYRTVYKLQCIGAHTNARNINEYVSEGNEEVIINVGQNWKSSKTSFVVSYDLFRSIIELVDNQLSWNLKDTLSSINVRCNEAVSKLSSKV